MQYGVYIDQAAITKAGLAGATDATDWLLIEYLRCWWKTGKGRSTSVDGKAYYWLNYRRTLEENPLLGFRTKSALSRRVTKLTELEVLDVVITPDGTLYARPGEKLEEVDRLRFERDPNVDKSASKCGKALRTRNTRCADATGPVAQTQQHNQSTNQSEEERAAARRGTSLQAPSHKQPRRANTRDPIGEVHRFAVDGIRARVPDFVDHRPDVSRKAVRDRALAFGINRVPNAPPNEQLAVGSQRVRELLAFLFASKRERLPLIERLDRDAWTVRAVVSGATMEALAQHAGRKKAPTDAPWARVQADWEAEQRKYSGLGVPCPSHLRPKLARARASPRRPTARRSVVRLADTGTGPSVMFQSIEQDPRE